MHVKRAIAWSALFLSCSGKQVGQVSTTEPGHGGGGISSGGSSGALIDASLGTVDAGPGGAFPVSPRDSGSDGAPCASISSTYELLAVDAYVLVDVSASMGETIPGSNSTWWDAVHAGISSFARTPSASSYSVGFQYFPLSNTPPASCEADYSTPEVELAPLSENADKIDQSLARHVPGFGRPTGPALLGGHAHMTSLRPPDQSIGRMLAVVLVTNGDPTECLPSTADELAAAAEKASSGSPQVMTYTVALGPSALEMTKVGFGDAEEFSIRDGDVPEAVRRALLRVLFPFVGRTCSSFSVPAPFEGRRVDLDRIVVVFDSLISGYSELPRVSSVADCARYGGGGWYLSTGDSGSTIDLCPETCADMPGRMTITFGCLP